MTPAKLVAIAAGITVGLFITAAGVIAVGYVIISKEDKKTEQVRSLPWKSGTIRINAACEANSINTGRTWYYIENGVLVDGYKYVASSKDDSLRPFGMFNGAEGYDYDKININGYGSLGTSSCKDDSLPIICKGNNDRGTVLCQIDTGWVSDDSVKTVSDQWDRQVAEIAKDKQ